MNLGKYIALLRGVNVGGKMVKMSELKKALESLGFTEVRTLLNSGNVIFESTQDDMEELKKIIEEKIEKKFGFHVSVIISTHEEVVALVAREPFGKIVVTPQTRLYVTFLGSPTTSKLKLPYKSTEKDFQILSATETEVCSVLSLSEQRNTTDVMKVLEQEFGKNITTRNWNTVLKLIK